MLALAALHWLARSHWPEFIWLGPFLKCRICDLGTPTVSPVRPALMGSMG